MAETTSGSTLLALIDERSQQVKTRGLDLSFNELLDMYKGGELKIDPEYQRLFRWPLEKRSRFIESLLLEMPIPPIYVIEIEPGVFDLIDGLQRVSSYLHLRGALPPEMLGLGEPDFSPDEPPKEDDGAEDANEPVDSSAPEGVHVPAASDGPQLKFVDCDIIKELNKFTYSTLPAALQFKLKRASVRVEVIRRASDPQLRYHMFKRLNTGGEMLSEQEVRNCTVRLLDPRFNDFLIECSQHPVYRTAITCLAPDKKAKKYDQEFVLRYFAFKNWRANYYHSVSEFLTDYMERVSDPSTKVLPFDYAEEQRVFVRTFQILTAAFNDMPFAASDVKGKVYTRWSVLIFEAFTVGLAPHVDRLDPANEQQMSRLREALETLRTEKKFRKVTVGGGLNYAKPLNRRIELVEKRLSDVT